MTRMIERWFPCQEVSSNSTSGWGSGNAERNLFTWFAARPAAQAKAAVICSLLPWPDAEPEQKRLQDLVRKSMTGRYAAWDELRTEILAANPDGVSLLDPFSGRGMIPLEAARLGLTSFGLDYSPVAVLASELLAEYPMRDWSQEPPLLLREQPALLSERTRLVDDVAQVLAEVGARHRSSLAEFFPTVDENQPWGYLWAMTLPCQECGRRFPLVGSLELRRSTTRKARKGGEARVDLGQSYYIDASSDGSYHAVVHAGPPRRSPTLTNAAGLDGKKAKGKSAICPFCNHVHPLPVHQRLAGDGQGCDTLLLVGEIDKAVGKIFRAATGDEQVAADSATKALAAEGPFAPGLTAVPEEAIPLNNGATIRPQLYGARTYGDLMVDRQTLSTIRLCRAISDVGSELTRVHDLSSEYADALVGYAAATLVRLLRYSTRGAWLRPRDKGSVEVAGIFVNESTIAFSHDFFETGPYLGPATWSSMSDGTVSTLKALLEDVRGAPMEVVQGSAIGVPFRSRTMTTVVTDPPYDAMVYYTDSSDFFFSWLKRALFATRPELTVTADPRGLQDKTEELIVKEHGRTPGEHRDRAHYDTGVAKAFSEMRRVVRNDGVVTIVFGHGDPEVWRRLLGAISHADLVMTGSWPARTESGGQQGKANIETTLTMACRPAPANRPSGRKVTVEAEIRAEVRSRVIFWEKSGLAPTDMLMAASGPAMEVVGRYSEVLDARGEPVDIATFLPLARAAVQEAMAVEIDHHPLETFDARTRFALWWVRLHGRQVIAKSELRWQALAASMDLDELRDLVPDTDKGCRFVTAKEFKKSITAESSVIDVAMAMAKASEDGLQAAAEVLLRSSRDVDDAYLWSAIAFLADRLPDSDSDTIAWTRLLRNRSGVSNAMKSVVQGRIAEEGRTNQRGEQIELF